MTSVVDNSLDLVLLFVFDQISRWTHEVRSVGRGFSIGEEERGVKYVMDSP